MRKSIWNSLKKFLRIGVLASGLFFSARNASALGRLDVYNYCPAIAPNSVSFEQSGGNQNYEPYPFPPSMEIYCEDLSSNKWEIVDVNLSTNKYYHCPLAGQGTIPDGTSNSIAFKIVSEWPSNTFCTAGMQTESGFSNFIGDVLAYTRANSNAQGYAFANLPATTNASDRVYGNVVVRFAPLEEIVASAGANGSISPSGAVKVAYSDNQTFTANANEDYRISDIKTNGASIGQSFGNDSTNHAYTWSNVTANGAISADFAERTTPSGIPFTWFTQYGLTNKTAEGEQEDSDSDGMNHLGEYIAGTNPTNSESLFEISNLRNGSSFELEILNSSTGRTYYVDASTNLADSGSWTYTGTNSVGNGSNLTFHLDANGDNRKFYRARVGLN